MSSSLPSWIPTGTSGRTYWVATNGNDTTGDGSIDNPWATINRAVNAVGVGAGDTVMVRPGTYDERVFFWRGGGSPEGQLTVKSEIPGAALIRNDPDDPYPYPFIVDNNYITIDGFDVSGGPDGSGISVANAHHVVIKNNIIHGSGLGGLGSYRSEFVVFDSNVVFDNAWNATNNPSGISILLPENVSGDTTTEGPRNIVTNNIVYDNYLRQDNSFVHTDGNGIIMDTFWGNPALGVPAYTYGALVENNLAYGNGGHGIHVFKADYITVRNNTVAYNNWDPYATYTWRGELSNVNGSNNVWVNNIAVADTTTNASNTAIANNSSSGTVNDNVVWENNLTFNGTVGAASLNITAGNSTATAENGNLLGVDPMFTNAAGADFSLLPGSPALEAGTARFGLALTDLDGGLRTVGTVDIGAYEKDAPANPDDDPDVQAFKDYWQDLVDAGSVSAAHAAEVIGLFEDAVAGALQVSTGTMAGGVRTWLFENTNKSVLFLAAGSTAAGKLTIDLTGMEPVPTTLWADGVDGGTPYTAAPDPDAPGAEGEITLDLDKPFEFMRLAFANTDAGETELDLISDAPAIDLSVLAQSAEPPTTPETPPDDEDDIEDDDDDDGGSGFGAELAAAIALLALLPLFVMGA